MHMVYWIPMRRCMYGWARIREMDSNRYRIF